MKQTESILRSIALSARSLIQCWMGSVALRVASLPTSSHTHRASFERRQTRHIRPWRKWLTAHCSYCFPMELCVRVQDPPIQVKGKTGAQVAPMRLARIATSTA
jgi:hypothetical protein